MRDIELTQSGFVPDAFRLVFTAVDMRTPRIHQDRSSSIRMIHLHPYYLSLPIGVFLLSGSVGAVVVWHNLWS